MPKSLDEDGNPTDRNLLNIFNASENIEPIVKKSIMKKPGTPVPGSGVILGKRVKNNQTLEELINQCNQEDSDMLRSPEQNCLGVTSANMG